MDKITFTEIGKYLISEWYFEAPCDPIQLFPIDHTDLWCQLYVIFLLFIIYSLLKGFSETSREK